MQTSGRLAGPDVCLCMTCGDDDESSCTHTHGRTHRRTERPIF